MASADLSRVQKVVGYAPLSKLSERERREFHEALLEATTFGDLPGKWQAAILQAEQVTSRRRSTSATFPARRRPRVRALPARLGTPLLFPTPSGKLWWERNFKRDVWYPAQERWAGIDPQLPARERRRLVVARGFDVRPHDFRHSWVTHMRAAGIDPADLAEVAGHTVETATARYTHALRRSDARIRQVIG